jgi:hypothetical protein
LGQGRKEYFCAAKSQLAKATKAGRQKTPGQPPMLKIDMFSANSSVNRLHLSSDSASF